MKRHAASVLVVGAAIAAISTTLAGCDLNAWDKKRNAKAAVSRMMKDPESAKFRGLEVFGQYNSAVVCGQVNAKNGFGAYAGYERFISRRDASSVYMESQYPNTFNTWWQEECHSQS